VSSSSYEIEWAASALRSLHRLPHQIALACFEVVYGGLAENPQRVGRALRFELEGRHSARRGDFRVIYVIDAERRVATIIAIDHRSDVYRRR